MDTSELEKHLEIARQRMNSFVHYKNSGEFHQARATVLSLERKIAAERGEEYADSLDFPVQWDTGAPLPQLIANDYRTFLIFVLRNDHPEDFLGDSIALVQFHTCLSVKLGAPNEEVLNGHPLYGKGLEYYSAQIVRNSNWIQELETINKVHSHYRPELWRSVSHYIFGFHDKIFECIAQSYTVEVFQKGMDDVVEKAARRLLQ
jgi:hypothetical protein